MKSKFPVNKAVKANGKYDKYSSKPVDSAKGAKNAHLKWENAEDDDDDDNSQNSANDSEEDVSDNDNEENIDEYFESEPEEHGNAYESDGYEDMEEGSTGDGEGDYSDEDEDEPLPPRPHPGQVSTKAPTTKKPISEVLMPSNVPLYKLLAKQHKLSALSDAHALSDQHTHKRPKKAKRARTDAELDEEGGKKKRNKRAPTEMRSDKPVRRLRVDADNSVKKSVDPRFADYTGELNQKIYAKNYSFLEDYRESEIQQLSAALKRAKGSANEEEIKHELLVLKQQLSQRQQALRTMSKIDTMEREEREKVKAGVKTPFYLKKSAKKQILLEERFKDLKKTGKLGKYMERKQKKQHRQQTRYMPDRRDG